MISRLSVALRYLLVALVIPAAMNLVGCRTPMFRGNKELSAGVPAKISTRGAAEQALAEALWSYHEVAITDTLNGISAGEYRYYDSGREDFERAVDFFEFTTGILSETGTHFGRRITPDLGEALDRWRQWHREHRGRLYFDQENCVLGATNVGFGTQPNTPNVGALWNAIKSRLF